MAAGRVSVAGIHAGVNKLFFFLIFFDVLWHRLINYLMGGEVSSGYFWPPFLVISIVIFLYGKREWAHEIGAVLLAFYMVLCLFSLLLLTDFPFIYLTFNTLYFFAFPLVVYLSYGAFHGRGVGVSLWLFALISFVAMCLGVAQYWLNDPLVDVNVGSFSVKIIEQLGTDSVRAFSVFASAYDYGVLIVAIGSGFFGVALTQKNKLVRCVTVVFVIIAFGFLAYTTQTRNIMLGMMVSLVAILLTVLSGFFRRNMLVCVVAMNVVVCAVVYNIDLFLSTFVGIFDSASLDMRLVSAVSIISKYLYSADYINIIFGHGLVQKEDDFLYQQILVDNTFIDVYIFSGMVGLVVYIGLYLNLLARVKVKVSSGISECRSWFDYALLGVVSSYICMAMFNIYVVSFYSLVAFVMVYSCMFGVSKNV